MSQPVIVYEIWSPQRFKPPLKAFLGKGGVALDKCTGRVAHVIDAETARRTRTPEMSDLVIVVMEDNGNYEAWWCATMHFPKGTRIKDAQMQGDALAQLLEIRWNNENIK